MLNVSIRQLRIFVAVAKHGSFARAAEEMHISPPAVSMQISDLETSVGLPLFDRVGRTASLTMTGEYFLVHARRILGSLREAEDTIARFRGLKGGTLRIGMVSTSKYFVPRLLARFRTEHPAVELRLSVGNRESLVESLTRSDVDLAIMGRPPRELATRAEPFAAHPYVIVSSPTHPLAQLEHVRAAALASQPFIVREPTSGTRASMAQYFRDHQIEPFALMEMPSNETIKQAVIADMGIAFLSLHTLGLELQFGLLKILPVEDLPLMRRWFVIHPQAKTLSPAAESFRYFILEQGEKLLAAQFGTLAPHP
jgi:LysR family transcriptional regulator, low CO2-responsive transcriptional regulator